LPVSGLGEQLQHPVCQHAGQRQAAALPARHRLPAPPGASDISREIPHPQQLEAAAGEEKNVSGPESGNETLLDGAQVPAPLIADLHGRITGDGADAHAVPGGLASVSDTEQALGIAGDPMEVRIGLENWSAAGDEGQCPVPGLLGEIRKRVSGADFLQGRRRFEPAPRGQRDQMLGEHIQAQAQGPSGLHVAIRPGPAGRCDFHQFQRVAGDAENTTDSVRLVSAASGTLGKPGHSLGAAHLDDPIHRREVHSQIQA